MSPPGRYCSAARPLPSPAPPSFPGMNGATAIVTVGALGSLSLRQQSSGEPRHPPSMGFLNAAVTLVLSSPRATDRTVAHTLNQAVRRGDDSVLTTSHHGADGRPSASLHGAWCQGMTRPHQNTYYANLPHELPLDARQVTSTKKKTEHRNSDDKTNKGVSVM